jgi:hypothetical protein
MQFNRSTRRELITLLGGAAAGMWPLVARADNVELVSKGSHKN